MGPADFRTARKRLKLTQKGLAERLRMGKWGWQSVAKWERGEIPVPGPVQVALELMLAKEGFVQVKDGGVAGLKES